MAFVKDLVLSVLAGLVLGLLAAVVAYHNLMA